MRSSRMRGYGAWCQGWRDGQRLPPSQGGPGIFFWLFILLVLVTCVQVAIQGHPFALLLGLAVLAGAMKGQN